MNNGEQARTYVRQIHKTPLSKGVPSGNALPFGLCGVSSIHKMRFDNVFDNVTVKNSITQQVEFGKKIRRFSDLCMNI